MPELPSQELVKINRSDLNVFLQYYDRNKGLFRNLMGDSAFIKNLRGFMNNPENEDQDEFDSFALVQELLKAKVEAGSLSLTVFEAILSKALASSDKFETANDNSRRLIVENYIKVLKAFYQNRILDRETFFILTKEMDCTESDCLHVVTILLNKQILTKENFIEAMGRDDSLNFAKILADLQEAEILNEKSKKEIFAYWHPAMLTDAFIKLKKENLLNVENRQLITEFRNPIQAAFRLIAIKMNKLVVDVSTKKAIINSTNPNDVIEALVILQDAAILIAENIAVVMQSRSPQYVANALAVLNKVGLITPESRELLHNSECPIEMAQALVILAKVDKELINPENVTALRDSDYPPDMAEALVMLKKSDILNDEHRAISHASQHPFEMAQALVGLKDADMLKDRTIKILVAEHQMPLVFVQALRCFQDSRQLTSENRDEAASHQNPLEFAQAIVALDEHRILSPANRVTVRSASDPLQSACKLIHSGRIVKIDDKQDEAMGYYNTPLRPGNR